MTNLDEKTTVPLGWAITAFGAAASGLVFTCFFVFTVDARLTRIEHKLGITEPVSSTLVTPVQAMERTR